MSLSTDLISTLELLNPQKWGMARILGFFFRNSWSHQAASEDFPQPLSQSRKIDPSESRLSWSLKAKGNRKDSQNMFFIAKKNIWTLWMHNSIYLHLLLSMENLTVIHHWFQLSVVTKVLNLLTWLIEFLEVARLWDVSEWLREAVNVLSSSMTAAVWVEGANQRRRAWTAPSW